MTIKSLLHTMCSHSCMLWSQFSTFLHQLYAAVTMELHWPKTDVTEWGISPYFELFSDQKLIMRTVAG